MVNCSRFLSCFLLTCLCSIHFSSHVVRVDFSEVFNILVLTPLTQQSEWKWPRKIHRLALWVGSTSDPAPCIRMHSGRLSTLLVAFQFRNERRRPPSPPSVMRRYGVALSSTRAASSCIRFPSFIRCSSPYQRHDYEEGYKSCKRFEKSRCNREVKETTANSNRQRGWPSNGSCTGAKWHTFYRHG